MLLTTAGPSSFLDFSILQATVRSVVLVHNAADEARNVDDYIVIHTSWVSMDGYLALKLWKHMYFDSDIKERL